MTGIHSDVGWLSRTQVGQCGDGDDFYGYGRERIQKECYQDGECTQAMAAVR